MHQLTKVYQREAVTTVFVSHSSVIAAMSTDQPKYPWFQRPAPTAGYTLAVAAVLLIVTFVRYRKRVEKIKSKFADGEFTGSLRTCAKISAYMDHHEEPSFAILRVCAKAFLFLGLCQWKYHVGFIIMMVCLMVESSLDTFRVLSAYWNCKRLGSLSVIADEEAHDLRDTATLCPTNVYEDLTRPRSIAILVFLTQVFLVGLVMDDSFRTTTRTCFNGEDGCDVLTSLGTCMLHFGKSLLFMRLGSCSAFAFFDSFLPQVPTVSIYWERSWHASSMSALAIRTAKRNKIPPFGSNSCYCPKNRLP